MSTPTKELLAKRREEIYAALKRRDFDLYRRSIQAAEGVVLHHRLGDRPTLAADIEAAVVLMVADAVGVDP